MTFHPITLYYEWSYRVHGKHHKRNYEYPVVVTGRSFNSFTIDTSISQNEQNKQIKDKMKELISISNRQYALEQMERYEDEEIEYEEFKIWNIREATRWSDLEDFSYTK
jgi:hypothetical protein